MRKCRNNHGFRKFFFIYCSKKYNPDNEFLYLDVTKADYVDDLIKEVVEHGVLEPQETYIGHYSRDLDFSPSNKRRHNIKIRGKRDEAMFTASMLRMEEIWDRKEKDR